MNSNNPITFKFIAIVEKYIKNYIPTRYIEFQQCKITPSEGIGGIYSQQVRVEGGREGITGVVCGEHNIMIHLIYRTRKCCILHTFLAIINHTIIYKIEYITILKSFSLTYINLIKTSQF